VSKNVKIANYLIGIEHPPFIIAEMSGNHNQSLERILEAANENGYEIHY
jgi:N-acetylneuraminate synthase